MENMNSINLFKLFEDLFEDSDRTYANIAHNNSISSSEPEINVFKNIKKGTKNIDSIENEQYLKAILTQEIFDRLCKAKNGNESRMDTTRRMRFVRGTNEWGDDKYYSNPLPLLKKYFVDDKNKYVELLDAELERIQSLLKITATIKFANYELTKDERYNDRWVLFTKSLEDNHYQIAQEEEKLKRILTDRFAQSVILPSETNKTPTSKTIDVYIAAAIMEIIFENTGYEYYIENDESKKVDNSQGRRNEHIIKKSKITSAIRRWRDQTIKDIEPNFESPFFLEDISLPKQTIYLEHKELETLFMAISANDNQVFVLAGERGIGKTTLALQLSKKLRNEKNFRVVRCAYKNSLRDTIADIERKKLSDNHNIRLDERFDRNISDLKTLSSLSPVVLIIDNYENPHYNQELFLNPGDYLRLRETGVKLLITSTQSEIGNQSNFDGHLTDLSFFETNRLKELFNKVSGRCDHNSADVEELIEKCINQNTYLVVLVAELVRDNTTIEDIIKSISALESDNTSSFQSSTASEQYGNQTLMKHFTCVLDKSKIVNPDDDLEKKDIHRILYVLALLPVGGVPESFFNILCGESTSIIKDLEDRHIIFKGESEEGNARVWLQPIVQEYVNRCLLMYNDGVLEILSILKYHLNAEKLDSNLWMWMKLAESVIDTLWNRNKNEFKGKGGLETPKTRTEAYFKYLQSLLGSPKPDLAKTILNNLELELQQLDVEDGEDVIQKLQTFIRNQRNELNKQQKEKKDAAKEILQSWGVPDGITMVDKVLLYSCVINIKLAACYSGVDMFKEGRDRLALMDGMLRDRMTYEGNINKFLRDRLFRDPNYTDKDPNSLDKEQKKHKNKDRNEKFEEIDKETIANCFATISYTLLNTGDTIKASEFIAEGKALLDGLNTTDSQVVSATLIGLEAGCLLNQGKATKSLYTLEQAKDRYQESLDKRTQLVSIFQDDFAKSVMISKISLMHRGIGTAYFYMAGLGTDKIDYLFRSCQSHWCTIELYINHDFDQETIGTIGNYNRFSGSLIAWLNASNANLDEVVTFNSIDIDGKQTETTKTVEKWIKVIYEYMRKAFVIYKSSKLNRTPEIVASLEKLIQLSQLLKDKCLVDKVDFDAINEALSVVPNLENINDQCRGLLDCLDHLSRALSESMCTV